MIWKIHLLYAFMLCKNLNILLGRYHLNILSKTIFTKKYHDFYGYGRQLYFNDILK